MYSDRLEAAIKTAKNAEALIADAVILARHGRWPRSYALAHLAQEEAAKAEMIRRLPEGSVLEEALKSMRGHIAKLEMAANVVVSGDETSEEARAVVDGARETSGTFNDLKNRSLYADYYEGGFWMPSEYITSELVEGFLPIAKFAVQQAQGAIEDDLADARKGQVRTEG